MIAEKPVDPEVIEAELIPLAEVIPKALAHPPAVIEGCACGKDGSPFAHGLMPGRKRAFSCDEVLQIRARVAAGIVREQRFPRRLVRMIGGA